MPASQISRDEVLERVTAVFQRLGYEGTSLTTLSKATGLVKASLYHHFPDGKKAMAIAAIERSAQQMAELVVAPLLEDAPAKDRLLHMIDGVNAFYREGADLCLFAVMSVGDARDLFYPHIAPHIETWANALTECLVASGVAAKTAGEEAEQMIVIIEGSLIMARASRDQDVFQRALNRLRNEVSKPSAG